GQHDRVAHRQHQDPGGDLDLVGQRGGEGQRVERLEPGVAVEPGGRQEVVDDPHVDAVVLALLDGLADAPDVLRIARAAAPGIGGDPGTELELRHRRRPPRTGVRIATGASYYSKLREEKTLAEGGQVGLGGDVDDGATVHGVLPSEVHGDAEGAQARDT